MIHFIWLGSPLPDDDARRIDAFRPYGEVNLVTEIPRHLEEYCQGNLTWQAKSDLVRYWLMCEYGGIYLDTDCEPGNLSLPTHTCVGGCTKKDGTKCWSNFLCSAEKPNDSFWLETFDRCKKQHHVDPREPMNLFFYNIECLWGITPLIPTVECWQNEPWFEPPKDYVIKHLARTKIDDYIVYNIGAKAIKRKQKAVVDPTRCNGCEHFNPVNELCRKHGCVARARIPNLNVRCPSGRW